MIKRKCKLGIGLLSAALLVGIMSSSVFAASWTTNLGRWKTSTEIGEIRKTTNNRTYYMKVEIVHL